MPSIIYNLFLTSAVGAGLLLRSARASEVNSDDLWGNCGKWQPCIDVVAIAEGCGTEKTVGGDVFSSPKWVDCTCSQVSEKQMYDCSTVCLEYFREGGDLKKLKDACGY